MPQPHENQPNFPPPPPPRSNIWSSVSQHPQEMDSAYSSPPPPRDSDNPWTPGRPPIGYDHEQPAAPPPRFEATKTPTRRSRKPAALLAGAAVIASAVGFGVNQLNDSEETEPVATTITETTDTSSHAIEQEQPLRSIFETESKPSAELIASFEADLADSTCDTPETATLAAEYYHDVFERTDFNSMELPELRIEGDKLTQNLEAARQNLSFTPLPENYQELFDRAYNEQEPLSLDVYKNALSNMLEANGIDALYDWEGWHDGDVLHPSSDIVSPTLPSTPDEERFYKSVLLGTMQAIATTPTTVLQVFSGADRFYFGNIKTIGLETAEENIVGAASINGYLVFNTTLGGYSSSFLMANGHELAHAIQYNTCDAFMDTAWNKQNPDDFEFTGNKEHPNYTDALSVSLGDSTDRPVISMRDYGLIKPEEQYATLVGEYMLDPTNTEHLFKTPERTEVIKRQTALILARFHELDSEVAEQYKWQLIAGALEHEAQSRADGLWTDAQNAIRDHVEKEGSADITSTKIMPEGYTAATEQMDIFNNLATEIHNAQMGPIAVEPMQKGGVETE